MKRTCIAAALSLSASMPGLAQDHLRTPVSEAWSGPYVGVVAGAASGRGATQSVVGCGVNGFLCDPVHYPENGAALGAAASGSSLHTSATAGVLAGYNWRSGLFVYGAEADASALHLSSNHGGSRSSLNLGLTNPGPVPVIATIGSSAKIDGLATLRARAGYLVAPSLLVYATGGVALTKLTVTNGYTDDWQFNGGAVGGSRSSARVFGAAFGAGLEWNVARSWTLRAEYLHASFGARSTTGDIFVVQVPAARNTFGSSGKLRADLFRLGSTFSF
ncbi:MAG: porin family protein [Hyphomicrobiales bacterium]|nr:porin family protein [Hyphomicrobiales bacterium]